ncbi:MAG: c-type cytochrome [Paracoccaceae bacterium]
MGNKASLISAMLLLAGAAMAQDVQKGEETYLRYCSTCHGVNAQGGGPTAAVLTLQPTDLTRLRASNGGIFPTERVVMRIDGREPLVSHGSPMPIYGEFFEGSDAAMKTPEGMPILTSQPIVDLVAWMESIQQ